MSATESAVLIGTAAAAALLGYVAARRMGSSSSSINTAPPPPAQAPGAAAAAPDPATPPADGAASWSSKLFGEWSGLITTAGTLAAALGTYQLTKDIGKGELDQSDHLYVVASAACFALGIGLLITIPVSLRTRNRVMITDAVVSQRRWNRLAKLTFNRVRHRIVPPSSLFGYNDLVEFDDKISALATEMRSFWENGYDPPAEVRGRQQIFRGQRAQIEDLVATRRLRSASRRAVVKAAIGMILAVAGYVNATYVTNQGQREAEVVDSETENAREVAKAAADQSVKVAEVEVAQTNDMADADAAHRRELEKLILEDSLADAAATQVLPALASTVTVSFPDVATAAGLFGQVEGAFEPSCAVAREGTALDIGGPPAGNPAERIIFVAFSRNATCRAGAGWVEPAWLGGATETPASTVPTAEQDDSATDGDG